MTLRRIRRIGRCPAARWAGTALAALALTTCGRPSGGTRIVLVTLDTLRFDCVESAAPSMPKLAAAARRGADFERAWAATSSTQPTHASLLTGLHPWQHGVHRNGEVLQDSVQTVTETLHAAGWWTGAVVASLPLARKFGFAQGFDVFDDAFTTDLEVGQWADDMPADGHFFTPCGEVTRRALALLDEAEGDKQFLWVHYFDAHAPYGDTGDRSMKAGELLSAAKSHAPGLQGIIAQARRLYDQDTTAIDASLDQLLSRLARDEPAWQTHVVITADHGESFGEDGGFGHGSTLTPPQVHVPLVLLSPRVAPGPRSDVSGSVDVAATLLALAGLPLGAGHGRDLTQAPPAASSAFGMRRTFAEPAPHVRVDGTTEMLQGDQFYAVVDGQQVVGDAQAIADAPPERAEELKRLFGLFDAELQAQPVEELLDPQTQGQLEALGYVR